MASPPLVQVGARAPSFDWGDAWWERTFDGAAKALAPKAGSPSSSSSSSSSSSDGDGAAAPTATAARHRDGTTTSATPAEMKLAARLAKDKWGRFGGRDGKMARIAAMEAAAADAARARLGGTAAATAGPSEGAPPQKKRKKATRAAPSPAPEPPPPPPPDAPPPYTPPPGWWGAATFKHAGRLEGLDTPKPVARRGEGFTEADQEAAAAAGVNKGDKRGLGAAAAGRLGRGWTGKKTTFGEEEAEEREDDTPAAAAAPSKPSSIKWKKLAAAALADKPLRLNKLVKRMTAAAVERHGLGAGSACAAADAEAAVRGSSKFRVRDDGRVEVK